MRLLLLVALVSAVPLEAQASCPEPSQAAVEAAKGLHRAAEVYFEEERHRLAISAWQQAYELDCRAHRLLINIGNAQAEAGELDEAIAAYETYLARDDDPKTEPEAARRLEELRRQASGDDSEPAPEREAGAIGAWVAASIGCGAAVAGFVLLGVGLEGASHCSDPATCPTGRREARREGILLQEIGGGLAAVGLSAAAGALLWMFFDEGSEEQLAWQPLVGPGWAGLGVRF